MATAGELIYKVGLDASAFETGLGQAERRGLQTGQRIGTQVSSAINQKIKGTEFDLSSPLNRGIRSAESVARAGAGKIAGAFNSVFQGIGQGIGQSIIGAVNNAVSSSISRIGEVSGAILKIGSDAENLRIAFRTIIGDAGRADKLLADLRKFSAATPYTGQEVTGAAQTLLTVVRPEDMIRTLTRLGDVASGVRKPISEIASIYQQVLSKGKLEGEELLQLAERGIPIQEAVAEVLKVQKEQVADLGSKGKITGDVLIKAFDVLADKGGKFNGIMQQQSQTLSGLASTFVDKLQLGATQVFDKLNPALKQMLNSFDQAVSKAAEQSGMMEIVARISKNIETFFKSHQDLVNKIVLATAQWIEKGLLLAVKKSEELYDWLRKNPKAIKDTLDVLETVVKISTIILDINNQILYVFWEIGKAIAPIVVELDKWVDNLLKGVDVAKEFLGIIGQAPSNSGGGSYSDNSFVNGGRYDVRNPNGSRATSYSTSTIHHNMSGKYHTHGGQRHSSRGVAKDFTLFQNGKSNVPVPSPVSGTVVHAGLKGGYGNAVIIKTPDGHEVVLGHFAENLVKQGQQVSRGQSLGIQGSTGVSQGVHTHIEAPEAILKAYYESLNSGNWGNASNLASGLVRGKGGQSASSGLWSKKNIGVASLDANLAGFLQAIAAGESSGGTDTSTSSAGARGIYQFIPSTRAMIKKQSGYDAWSKDPNEQAQAAIALIKSVASGEAYRAILQGDYSKAAKLLNKQWTSLEGGAEESRIWKNQSITSYLPTSGSSSGSSQGKNRSNEPKSVEQSLKDAELAAKNINAPTESQVKKDAEKRKREVEERRKRLFDAQQDVLTSDIALLGAISGSSNDRSKQAEAQIKQIELELKRQLSDLDQNKTNYNPSQFQKLRSNAQKAAQAKIKGIREDLAKSLAEELQQRQETQYQQWDERRQAEEEQQRLDQEAAAEFDRKYQDFKQRINQAKAEAVQKQNDQIFADISRGKDFRQAVYRGIDNNFAAKQTTWQSDIELAQAKAGLIADPDKQNAANRALGRQQIGLELQSQLQSIEQMGRSGQYTADQLARMRDNAKGLAETKIEALNKQFQDLGGTIQGVLGQGLGTVITDLLTGTKSLGESVSDVFTNIAAQLAQMAATRFISGIFGGGVLGFAEGSSGGGKHFKSIADAVNYEKARGGGGKPILAVLNDREAVLNADQVRALNSINSVKGYAEGSMRGFTPVAAGSNINLDMGTWQVSGVSEDKAAQLKDMIKASVYGILHHEKRPNGLLR